MSHYLLLAGKLLAALLIALMGLRAVWLFLRCEKNYMPADIWNAFRPKAVRRKWLPALVSLLFLGLLLAVEIGGRYQYCSLLIALTYPEASEGLNPNGSRFNMSNILCDEVLERAIALGGFEDIGVDDLRSGLLVAPASATGAGGSDSEEDEEEGRKTVGGLVSTQFYLSFSGTGKTGYLGGKEVVHAVAEAYREWFIEQYSVNPSVLDISFDDIDNYDYPQMKDYFATQLNKICNFTNAYYQKDSAFISSQTGESFLSLNTKGWDINKTELENFHSYILSYGLSKDTANYMSRLRFEHINQCNDYRYDLEAYDVRINAINRYDNDMATVVYIPTYDTDSSFYMSKTKIGIDHFSMAADQYSADAASLLDNILDQKYLLQQLNQRLDHDGSYDKVDEMITDLKEQILTLAENTRDTVKDYENTTSNGYISVSEPENGIIRMVIKVAAGAILALLLSYWNGALGGLNRKLMPTRTGREK